MYVFTHSSVFPTTLDAITAFHADPQALARLVPPPPLMFFQVLRDDRTSLTEGEIEFRLWLGPIPIRWLALHQPGPTPHSFADHMLTGPMATWQHAHFFTEVEGGIELTDHIELAHKPGLPGLLSRLVFDGLPLRLLFIYRHFRTRQALLRS
jgi:ligand-binding SRPBCC domain-containing protein